MINHYDANKTDKIIIDILCDDYFEYTVDDIDEDLFYKDYAILVKIEISHHYSNFKRDRIAILPISKSIAAIDTDKSQIEYYYSVEFPNFEYKNGRDYDLYCSCCTPGFCHCEVLEYKIVTDKTEEDNIPTIKTWQIPNKKFGYLD